MFKGKIKVAIDTDHNVHGIYVDDKLMASSRTGLDVKAILNALVNGGVIDQYEIQRIRPAL